MPILNFNCHKNWNFQFSIIYSIIWILNSLKLMHDDPSRKMFIGDNKCVGSKIDLVWKPVVKMYVKFAFSCHCFLPTILIRPIFRYTSGVYTKGIPVCVCPWGCPAHHLASTAQPQVGGIQERESTCNCTYGVLEYRGSENATLALVGCCKRRKRWQHIRAETSKRQKGEIWWNNSGMSHAIIYV